MNVGLSVTGIVALIWQVVDFLREVANIRNQRSAVVTQATAWVGGVAVVWLCSAASVAKGLVLVGNTPLGRLDFASIVLVGVIAASMASSLVDFKQAVDNRDTSEKPPLISNRSDIPDKPILPPKPPPILSGPIPQPAPTVPDPALPAKRTTRRRTP